VYVDAEQYRGLCINELVFQTVHDVLAFVLRDVTMLGGRVGGQKYPQYYCDCWHYRYTPHAHTMKSTMLWFFYNCKKSLMKCPCSEAWAISRNHHRQNYHC